MHSSREHIKYEFLQQWTSLFFCMELVIEALPAKLLASMIKVHIFRSRNSHPIIYNLLNACSSKSHEVPVYISLVARNTAKKGRYVSS